MTQKPPKTLAQMAAEANGQQPMQIAGKPADVCPYCGAGMFVTAKRPGGSDSFRYIKCRNEKCGRKFYSRHPKPEPGTIVREVDDESASSVREHLTLHKESA